MRLFGRKRDDEPVDMNERSPQLGLKYKDLMVLDQLMKTGADLTESRHVMPNFPDQWGVVCERHAVTSPDFVREADDFFQALADRHGAEYDGWEASA